MAVFAVVVAGFIGFVFCFSIHYVGTRGSLIWLDAENKWSDNFIMTQPVHTSFEGVCFSNFELSIHFFLINFQMFCFQKLFYAASKFTPPLLQSREVLRFAKYLFLNSNICPECSFLHGCRAAWQKQMALETSFSQVEKKEDGQTVRKGEWGGGI